MDFPGVLSTSNHRYEKINVYGGSAHLGDHNVTVNQFSENRDSLQRRQFLESVRYLEMNARYNEIREAECGTYNGMFETGQSSDLEDSFLVPHRLKRYEQKQGLKLLTEWLLLNHGCCLVEGKPGAGKSTFMKFLFENAATAQTLTQWSKGRSLMLLFHSFWRAGSKLQKSWKGFLANLVYQLVAKDPTWATQAEPHDNTKHRLHDWSEKELQLKLQQLISSSQRCLGIFIDGVDEFDPDDDNDKFIDFLRWMSEQTHVKLCVSSRPLDSLISRPRNATRMRLEDVNGKEIYTYVRNTIEKKLTRFNDRADANLAFRDDLAFLICHKADGVFIWVHWVLKSICEGIADEERLKDLYRRVEALPPKIIDLYKEMWTSSNSGSAIERRQTAQLFSLVTYFPLSLFHVLLVMESDIRKEYMAHLALKDTAHMQDECRRMAKIVKRRSAGLIECVTGEDYWLELTTGPTPQNVAVSVTNDLSADHNHRSKVQCIHRTVLDFLSEYQEDMLSVTEGKEGSAAVVLPLIEAYIACCVENVFEAEPLEVVRCLLLKLYEVDEDTMLLALSQIESQCARLYPRWGHQLMFASSMQIEYQIWPSKASEDLHVPFLTLWHCAVIEYAPIKCLKHIVDRAVSE